MTVIILQYTQNRIVKGGLKIPKKGFRTLRDECIKANKLYQDPQFPPNEYSISFKGVTRRSYVWKRPHVRKYFFAYPLLRMQNFLFFISRIKILRKKLHEQRPMILSFKKTLIEIEYSILHFFVRTYPHQPLVQ